MSRIREIQTVLEGIDAPRYSMGIPGGVRETIGYVVQYSQFGYCVRLAGNQNTKKYEKVLNQWGDIVKESLMAYFKDQIKCVSLKEFYISEKE